MIAASKVEVLISKVPSGQSPSLLTSKFQRLGWVSKSCIWKYVVKLFKWLIIDWYYLEQSFIKGSFLGKGCLCEKVQLQCLLRFKTSHTFQFFAFLSPYFPIVLTLDQSFDNGDFLVFDSVLYTLSSCTIECLCTAVCKSQFWCYIPCILKIL